MKKYIKFSGSSLEEDIFIDPKTGEICNIDKKIIWVQTEEQRRQSLINQKNKKLQLFTSTKLFVLIWHTRSKDFFSSLNPQNLFRLIYLTYFLNYEGYLKISKTKYMDKKDMFNILGINKRIFSEFYDLLIKNKTLIEKQDRLFIDSSVFFRGNLSNKKVAKFSAKQMYATRIYRSSISELYKNHSNSSHKTIGHLFKLIPYVSHKHNIVCHNPEEVNIQKIKAMSLKEICDVVNYTKNQSSRLYKTLSKLNTTVNNANQALFKKSEIDGNEYFFINPCLYYAGNETDSIYQICEFKNNT